MTECAWCETATGELVVPGARGAFVHPSCEEKRRGRRTFLGMLGLGTAAIAAAPLLELVPEGFPIYSSETGAIIGEIPLINYDAFVALTLEKYRPYLPTLFERESTFYTKIGALQPLDGKSSRVVRMPRRLR